MYIATDPGRNIKKDSQFEPIMTNYRIVDPFWITQMFAHFRHSFQNTFVPVRTDISIRICAISLIGINNVIEKWLQTMSDLKYELEFSYSILQGEAVFKIFETADNDLMMWIQITETYLQTLLVCQWYVRLHRSNTGSLMVCVQTTPCCHKVKTAWANDIITSWWSRASWSKLSVSV